MMEMKKFEENLLLYGADMHQWPEEIRQAGLKALESSSEMQTLLVEHEHFEKVIKTRRFEEPGSNLAQRIISASLQRKQKAPLSPGAFISELLNEFRLPKPALSVISIVMILVLAIGFAIGFSNYSNPSGSTSAVQEETSLQVFLYDEGDII
jgi:hypothetical protein